MQNFRDRHTRFSFHRHLQDLPFARTQAIQRARGMAFVDVIVDQHPGDLLAEIMIAGAHRAHRAHQLPARGLLEEIALRARLKRLENMFCAVEHRLDQDTAGGAGFPYRTSRVDAVELRHGDVHDHDRWLEALLFAYRLAPVRGITDHAYVGFSLQQAAQTVPYHAVIIREKYRDCHELARNFSDDTRAAPHRRLYLKSSTDRDQAFAHDLGTPSMLLPQARDGAGVEAVVVVF